LSIRFSDATYLDIEDAPINYVEDWKAWLNDVDALQILLEQIAVDELKYKRLYKFHNYSNKLLQGSLLVMGSSIVYVQAVSTDAELINKYNVASGVGTTIVTLLSNYVGFSVKAPHYFKVYTNLQRLRSWIENKLMIPIEKRFSPYDLYSIAKKAFDTILLFAKEGLQESG